MTLSVGIAPHDVTQEPRVALVPEVVTKLVKQGWQVYVPQGAGGAASCPDAAYAAAGATLLGAKDLAKTKLTVALGLNLPAKLPYAEAAVAIGLGSSPAAGAASSLALQKLPRTTRAQAMDVLSSQANLGGYAAALAVAHHLPRLLPALSTAAGSTKPAKVLILGVGVAGLQAIATARRLGAAVSAFDIRPEVAEQIKSLGAKVVEVDGPTAEGKGGYAGALDAAGLQQLQEKLAPFVAQSDGVITTAQVPGKAAPVLVSAVAVAAMQPGSVVVDMAAASGGNVAGTKAGAVVQTANGITLVGETNWPGTLAQTASRFWAQNMANLLAVMVKDGQLSLEDELVQAMVVA
ncbi:MAG: NAD(P)(+) transhydrogenase (Re/Si-specific) subunit alpha [Alphaproteobacteria bacterium]|nr:NAD(P)(+) transhydrogenase (Re/Si-specific) subunit alpha [Alphaproteobacteria bacterium]